MSQIAIIDFEVSGGGDFPFDMLRHGECFPVREVEDSYKLAGESDAPRRTVRLRSHTRFPAAGRWASFGWNVDWAEKNGRRLEQYAR